jgi:hypothetical protein
MEKQIPGSFFDVTPHDTNTLSNVIGLYVAVGGVIKAQGQDGVTATFTVLSGQYLVGEFTRVLSTLTTASGIVGLRR